MDHYSQEVIDGVDITVVKKRDEVRDCYMPGGSGAGGLAGLLHAEYRTKKIELEGSVFDGGVENP